MVNAMVLIFTILRESGAGNRWRDRQCFALLDGCNPADLPFLVVNADIYCGMDYAALLPVLHAMQTEG
jgi:hypothetical protein